MQDQAIIDRLFNVSLEELKAILLTVDGQGKKVKELALEILLDRIKDNLVNR